MGLRRMLGAQKIQFLHLLFRMWLSKRWPIRLTITVLLHLMFMKLRGSSQVDDMYITLFTPQPYIPMENRLVAVEDTTLGDGGVTFALAHSLTLPRDRESLEGIETPTLGTIRFNCLIAVSFSSISFLCTCLLFSLINLCYSCCSLFSISPSSTLGKLGTWRMKSP